MPKDRAYHREAVRRFSAEHPGYYARRAQQRKKKLNAIIAEFKNKPCMDCGGRFPPYVMDCDHVRGEKRFAVSHGWVNGVSERSLRLELEKCDVVCSNCHRIRTFTRLAEKADAAASNPAAQQAWEFDSPDGYHAPVAE